MGWLSWLARAKAAEPEQELGTLYRMILGKSPVARNTTGLLEAYKQVPQFRSVVSKIADHTASVHWRVYTVRGKGGKARYVRTGQIFDKELRDAELARHKQEGELEEVHDHPLAALFDAANVQHSGFDARRLTQIYLDVVGEAFWQLQRGAFKSPIGYWPIPPHWVRVMPTPKRPEYELRIDGRAFFVPADDMIWFRDPDPVEPYGRGSGVGEALGDEIDTSDYAAKYVKAFFYNRTKPDMLIGVENSSEAQVKLLGEAFRQKNLGYSRAHRTFWHSGKLKVHELNAKFGELEIMQLQGAVRDTFVHTFGIPPEVLGILTNSNRSTIKESLRLFAQETIVPRCERMRMRLQQRLVKEYDERLLLDYDSPVPEDDEFELQAMTAAPWAATRGEWRKMQGLEYRGEIDDVHLVPVALLTRAPDEISSMSLSLQARAPQKALPPASQKDAAQDLVDNALEALRPERMRDEMYAIHRQNVQAWGDEVLEELGVGVGFDILNPLTQQFFADWENNKIKLINQTTRESLNRTLIEGVRAGEGVRELTKRVTAVFDLAKGYRAERIARTEVLSASNHATYEAHVQSGVVAKRQWVATPDGRTRDEHIALDLDMVGIDEPFTVGGYSAMYPGEFGAPEMDINCRCTTVAVIEEPKSASQIREVWKAYDRRLVPWENALREASKRAFTTQSREVEVAVRRVFS